MNRYFLQVFVLVASLFFSHSLVAQGQDIVNNGKPIVLFVEFQFDAKNIALAIELLTEMQNQTYENEEGCITYDLHMSEENPNTIYIYMNAMKMMQQ